MSLRAKVHVVCVLGIVLCEIQCAALRYFADVLEEAGNAVHVD